MLPALLTTLALAAAPPGPHPGPPYNLQVEVAADGVLLQLLGEQQLLNGPFGLDPEARFVSPVSSEVQQRLEAGALALLRERVTMRVDGEERELALAAEREPGKRPAVFWASGLDNYEPTVQVDLWVPTVGLPDEVWIEWRLFPPAGDPVPGVVRHGDFQFEFFRLSPDDPSLTWYPAEVDLEPGALVRRPVAPGERGAAPLLWPALGSLALGTALVLALRGLGARLAAGVGCLALACLLTAWGYARPGPIRMPTDEEAAALFERLHGTIYAALSARSEDELYALLASAVEVDYIDELYLELRESMIKRNDGGAFCQVQRVETLGHELDLPETVRDERDLAFDVLWRWQVDGEVTHYGHTHSRRNLHAARYAVRYDGQGWKILGREVLEHARADDGEPLRDLMPAEDWLDDEPDDLPGPGDDDPPPPGEARVEGDG